ncbi:MAG: ABC transporter permease [Muribaculaceae bacterium]|nr:ABC transporter permease [Muribaculaceae bacterium]MDE6644184.1 ABC transporter permease [Muribaculaceae bacterium]
MQKGIIATIKREVLRLTRRKVYLFAMILVPLAVALFFISLMSEGLPLKVPTAVVDLDNSTLSRKLVRSLKAQELTDISMELTSFNEAIDKVRNGEIFGFFYMPRNLEKDAVAGNKPTITYYSNMTYFVPGTLAYKGFRTIAVTSSGLMAANEVVQMGIDESTAEILLQPMVIDVHPLGNPWTNYSYYLCNSFVPAALELMIFLVTIFSICSEIKTGESRKWLATADGSIIKALIGKLAPQTIVFLIVGLAIDSLFFKFNHFPMNGSWGVMLLAMLMFVIACQGFALFVTCVIPSERMALSICSLIGILAFSIAGFSFPVDQMYGAVGIFSYILPVRYYFLIYIDQALNGIPMYYSREYFAALLVFALAYIPLLFRLKKHLARPVYLP